jgi:hypothetical protein
MNQQDIRPDTIPAEPGTTPDLTAERTFRLTTALTGYRPLVLTCALADLPGAARRAFDPTGLLGTEVEVAADGSTATVLNPDGTPGFVFTVESEIPAEPDYWLSLAADLHAAADRIATLAGTTPTPARVDLSILGSVSERAAEQMMPVVDAIAEAFGGAAGPDERSTYQYSARIQTGAVHVHPYTFVPDRQESELERLRAELAELKAAQGGESR